jgi:hypothetical protein
MLTFEINGRTAIPVRAIPIITGGSFDAYRIIDLFYDPESWADSSETVLCASAPSNPRAFRINVAGTVLRVTATLWSLPRKKSWYQSVGAPDSPEQLNLLPPAVFVWLDEFKSFYTSLALDADRVRTPPAGAYGWDEAVALNESQEALVWEGFGSVRSKTKAPRRQQRNSRNAHLAELGQEIDQIIAVATANGFSVDKTKMPGQKCDLIAILKQRRPSREGRATLTYSDDFRELHLRWSGGRNRTDRAPFLACFGLEVE